MKEITSVDSSSGAQNILHESRFYFLIRKVRLLHRCLNHRDCIAIGLLKNVNENDPIEREGSRIFLICCSCERMVFPYTICLELKLGIHISSPIKK